MAHAICLYGRRARVQCGLRRRAQENSDVLGGCGKERAMIRSELLRRLRQDNALARMLRPLTHAPPQTAAAA